MGIRNSVKRDFGSIEIALANLVATFGNTENAAKHCEVSGKTLSSYANPDGHLKLRVDVVLDLERQADNPLVTKQMAEIHNMILVGLPSSEDKKVWDRHLVDVVKEASMVFHQLVKALEDEKMTLSEARELVPQVQAALSTFASLNQQLKNHIEIPKISRIDKLR